MQKELAKTSQDTLDSILKRKKLGYALLPYEKLVVDLYDKTEEQSALLEGYDTITEELLLTEVSA